MVRLPKSLHRRLACGGGCTVRADGQGRSRLGGMSRTLGPGAVDDGSPEMTGGGAAGDSRLLPLGTDGCCSGSSTAPEGWSCGGRREELCGGRSRQTTAFGLSPAAGAAARTRPGQRPWSATSAALCRRPTWMAPTTCSPATAASTDTDTRGGSRSAVETAVGEESCVQACAPPSAALPTAVD